MPARGVPRLSALRPVSTVLCPPPPRYHPSLHNPQEGLRATLHTWQMPHPQERDEEDEEFEAEAAEELAKLLFNVMGTVARAREGVRNTSGFTQKRQAPGGAHLGLHRSRRVPQVGLSQ